MRLRAGLPAIVVAAALTANGSNAQTARQNLSDAVAADPKHYTVEFKSRQPAR